MPAFREYFEVFQLFHLAKIFHGTKKEQKNVALDDLPDREGVRPPKQGRGRRRDTQRGCRRNQRWKSGGGSGRVGSLRRGCILRFTLGYLAHPISKGIDFSTTRFETERDDGTWRNKNYSFTAYAPISDELKVYILCLRLLREYQKYSLNFLWWNLTTKNENTITHFLKKNDNFHSF